MSAEEKQQKPPEEMALRDAGEQEEEEKSGFFMGVSSSVGRGRKGGEGRGGRHLIGSQSKFVLFFLLEFLPKILR